MPTSTSTVYYRVAPTPFIFIWKPINGYLVLVFIDSGPNLDSLCVLNMQMSALYRLLLHLKKVLLVPSGSGDERPNPLTPLPGPLPENADLGVTTHQMRWHVVSDEYHSFSSWRDSVVLDGCDAALMERRRCLTLQSQVYFLLYFNPRTPVCIF